MWLGLGAMSPCEAATRYVSTAPDASDSNPGTLASPWRTLQKAANTANPGDVVLVRGGIYPEGVVFSRSGNGAGSRIVFRAYPGETPIVDGSALNPATLTENALLLIKDVDWITIDGFELRNLRTTSADVTPKAVFVAGACEGIEILNCRIHHIENNRTASNGNAHGIAAYGWSAQPITSLRIEGNELHDLVLGASEALVVNGNVDGFEVIDNHVHHCNNIGIDFIGYEGVGPSPAIDRARNGVCRGNVVHDIDTEFNPAYGGNFTTGGGDQSAAGIYVDGGIDILIERNTVHHCNIGVELASEHAGRWTERITVLSNVIHLNDIGGLFLGGYSAAVGGTRDCVIRHNSFYQNDVNEDWNGEIYFQHETENNVVTHNVLFANSNGLFIGNPATSNSGNVVNWNLFHAPDGADIKWQWKEVYHYDLASHRAGTGNDADSLQTDPLYLSPATGDLRLQPTSPARDRGDPAFVAAPDGRDRDGNFRLNGGRVDLGAYEYGSVAGYPVMRLEFEGFSQALMPGDSAPGSADGSDFGFVAMGEGPVVRQLGVFNDGNVALEVIGATLNGGGFADFTLGSLPPTIPPGESAQIAVTFDPSALAVRRAEIELVSNAQPASFPFAVRSVGISTEAGPAGIPTMPLLPDDSPGSADLAFDPAMAGTYTGPITDRSSGDPLGHFARLRLNPFGGFTAVLFVNGQRSVLRGRFEGATPFAGTFLNAEGAVVTVEMTPQQTNSDAAAWRIGASLDGPGLMADAVLVRSAFHPRLAPCPWSGRYTLLMPPPDPVIAGEPEGTGWATLTVSPGGGLRVIGQMGDGSAIFSNGFVSADGEWFFHQMLYRSTPRGAVGGWVKFRDLPGISALNGEWTWNKTPDPRELRYPDGFSRTQAVVGSRFTPPSSGARALDELDDSLYNARLSLRETSLPTEGMERVISWLARDRIVHHGPERLSGSINRLTGQLRGLWVDPEAGQRFPFRGVVFQSQGIAAGCFLTPNAVGYLLVEPGSGFPYPGSETRANPADTPGLPPSPATDPARAVFAPNLASAGVYSGLLRNGVSIMGNLSAFRITASGAFSGAIWFQGRRFPLRGQLDPGTGAFFGQIARPGADPLDVSLQLEQSTTGNSAFFLGGTVTGGDVTASVDLHRADFHSRTQPVPEADRGRYTALLPADDTRLPTEPEGHGIALMTLGASGQVGWLIRLADGTAASRQAILRANGEIPLYVPLPGTTPPGYLGGEPRLREVALISDFDGILRWEKGANPRHRRYPGGFSLDQPLIGSRFVTPAPGERSLNAYHDGHFNAWIRFEGGSLRIPGPIDEAFSWLPSDRIQHFGPERLIIRMNRRNGMFHGIFDNRTGFRAPFRGVTFQVQDSARGFFLEAEAAGGFRIDPR